MALPTLRPLSVGEILDMSFGLYRRLFAPLVSIQVICSAVPFVLGLYAAAAGGGLANLGLTVSSYLLSFVLGALASAATAFVISENYLGEPMGAIDGLRRALPYTLPVAGVSLLAALLAGIAGIPFFVALTGAMAAIGMNQPGFGLALMLVGMPLLLLPVVVFSALAVSTQALVLEDLRNPLRALGRSWFLTKRFRLRIIGMILIFFVLLMVLVIGATVVLQLLGAALGAVPVGGEAGGVVAALWTAVISGLSVVLTPIFYCILTLAYYDLRVRKEGFDLEVLAAALQPQPA